MNSARRAPAVPAPGPEGDRTLARLRPSRLLAAGLALSHCAALVPLWLAGLPPFALGSGVAAILMHGAWAARRQGLLNDPGSVVALGVDASHRCVLLRRDGTNVRGRVAETTLVAGRLVALAVRSARFRPLTRVLIVPGMLDAEAFRALRVRLKWGRAQDPDASHA